nr:MAG: hypothetical protein [Lokiarchaeota virus Ratatoskr Meg22_1012]
MNEELNMLKVNAFDIRRELDVTETEYKDLAEKVKELKEIEAKKLSLENVYNDLKETYRQVIEKILALEKEQLAQLKSNSEKGE